MSDTPTAEQRAAWQKLADAATPGPWYAPALSAGVRHLERNESDWYFEGLPEGYELPGRQDGDGGGRDGAFIAAAREAVPALLAALSTVEAERDRLRDIADRRNHVTRVEVIDHRAGAERFGRAFVAWDAAVSLSYQDGSRTLKVFVDDPVSGDPQGNQT